MSEQRTIYESLLSAIELLEHQKDEVERQCKDIETELGPVTELRTKLQKAAQDLDNAHTRRVRAITRYNTEIERIAKHGKRAAQLIKAPLPFEAAVPPQVRLAVQSKTGIQAAVENAADSEVIYARICGVYFLLQDKDIVYIGQSVDVVSRIATHKMDKHKQFNRVCYAPVEKEDLDEVEGVLISMFKPKFNKRDALELTDDSLALFYKGSLVEAVEAAA